MDYPRNKQEVLFFATLALFGLVATTGFKYGVDSHEKKPIPMPIFHAPDKVVLTGVIESDEARHLENYKIALIEQEYGPFTGSFDIRVRKQDTYTLLVTPEHGTFPARIWYNQTPDDTHAFGTLSGFPSDSGTVHGNVFNLQSNMKNMTVEVDGVVSKVSGEGGFRVTNIPLGNKTIKLKNSESGSVLFEETINLELPSPTPYDIHIP